MSKRMRVLMLVLAVLMIVPSILAGCGGSEDPATTTTAATTTAATTTAATTTAATTTDAGTTTAATTTEATTPEETGLGGYEFVLSADGGLWTEQAEVTAEYEELLDLYAAIEEELDCTITVTRVESELEQLTTAAVGGYKLADFLECHQMNWIPLAMMGGVRPLDEMVEYGLDLYNDEVFNQTYTLMTTLPGTDGVEHVWGLDMSGKFASLTFGHYYAFNKELCEAAGYTADQMYQSVRDGEWDYEMMLDIGRKTTADTDGDGVFDVHGLALDADGNEIWSNGIDFIEYKDGKWISNAMHPQIMPALQFMADISQSDMQIPVFGNTAGRGDRRTNFYQGRAAFAGLYGGNIDGDEFREMAGNNKVGALPIPKGPDADHYMMCFVDFDTYICQAANQDWEKSIQVMNKIGAAVTDWEAFRNQCLDYYGGDEQAIEMIFDVCFPNSFLNTAKASENLYELTRRGFFSNIYELVLTPAASAETYQDQIQAEIDSIFQQ